MDLLINHHNWDQMNTICEEFESVSINPRYISIKERAADYVDLTANQHLTRSEFRTLLAKIQKLKNSSKKEERAKGIKLAKQIQSAFNIS